jgi:transcriptional regulator with XRE-family HTH domain
VAEPRSAQRRLADLLLELRSQAFGSGLTQSQLAAALGVSVPLLSSWENAKAVPPEERLAAYALMLASPEAFRAGPRADSVQLTADEEAVRRRRADELLTLRSQAVGSGGGSARQTGALGGTFWHFPDGAPIRIITTKMWPSVLDTIPYADPWHPNYIESYADADRDATIELFGHIRAENPAADVRFLTADRATQEDITGHVVVLGQADSLWVTQRHPLSEEQSSVLDYLAAPLELPLGVQTPPCGDPEFDSEFVVTLDSDGEPTWFARGAEPDKIEIHPPQFLHDLGGPGGSRALQNGLPVLEYDVGLLARRPNQLNLRTTITICAGLFSRGTFGAVRALTDANADLRVRNERFLVERFGSLGDFWFLFRVPVFRGAHGLDTVTPDFGCGFHQLRSST